MNKIGILYHPMKKAAYALAKQLEEFLGSKGLSVWLCSAWEGEEAKAQVLSAVTGCRVETAQSLH
ncbi:hypothetical protein ACFLT4_08125, partial [Chloroflexota bacterium]